MPSCSSTGDAACNFFDPVQADSKAKHCGRDGAAYTGPRETVIMRNRMGAQQGAALRHPVTKRLSRHNSYTPRPLLTNTRMCAWGGGG